MNVARSGSSRVLRKWWADNPDLHYPMTAYASIISVGSTMWGLLFIMLGGATDPQASSLVPISWACLILGGVGCFFLLPEFFLYISLRSTFEQICSQDNRTEIIRRRKELEDAAESLGSSYKSRVLGIYQQMEIKPNRRWRVAPSTATSQTKWWSNTNSKLSRVLPKLKPLKKQSTHKSIIAVTTISISMLILEASIGGMDGSTTSINDLILGSSESKYPPPYLDPISGILLTFLTILLWLTSPAPSEKEGFD